MDFTIPIESLTPERCQEISENGLLNDLIQNLIQNLHSHTLDNGQHSECNGEIFALNYMKNAEKKSHLSKLLHRLVGQVYEGKAEEYVLEQLELLRGFIDKLYIKNVRDLSSVSLAAWAKVYGSIQLIFQILEDSPEITMVLEKLGGAYVIVDLLQAEYIFHCEDSPAEEYKKFRYEAMLCLAKLSARCSSVNTFLAQNSSFMAMIVERLKDVKSALTPNMESKDQNPNMNPWDQWDGKHCRTICLFLTNLVFYTEMDITIFRKYGIVKCLIDIAMAIQDDRRTFESVLRTLQYLTLTNKLNREDFLAVDGALDFFICSLGDSSKEKYFGKDHENHQKLLFAFITVGFLRPLLKLALVFIHYLFVLPVKTVWNAQKQITSGGPMKHLLDSIEKRQEEFFFDFNFSKNYKKEQYFGSHHKFRPLLRYLRSTIAMLKVEMPSYVPSTPFIIDSESLSSLVKIYPTKIPLETFADTAIKCMVVPNGSNLDLYCPFITMDNNTFPWDSHYKLNIIISSILANLSQDLAKHQTSMTLLQNRDVSSVLIENLRNESDEIVDNLCTLLANITSPDTESTVFERSWLTDLKIEDILAYLIKNRTGSCQVNALKIVKNLDLNMESIQELQRPISRILLEFFGIFIFFFITYVSVHFCWKLLS